jgi:tetratricopeptide (TPR) repeat protein
MKSLSLPLSCIITCLLGACVSMAPAAATPRDEAAPRPLTQAQLTAVAAVLEERGDVVRAEQYFRLALEQGDDTEAILPQLIAAFVRDKQYRLALAHAQDYLRQHPHADRLRLLTGAIYEAVGNYGAAVEQYELVAQHRPEHAEVHYVLGAALLKQGHSRAEADEQFRKYLELAPTGRYAERAEASVLKQVLR